MTSLGHNELNKFSMTRVNSYDDRDRIFQFWVSVPCLLMQWLFKSPVHQQAWYWLCRTDMYCCARVNVNMSICTRVGVKSIISTPTPTPEVSTPTPTPANLQNINSNSNSGGFNSNSNSNSGKSPEYQLQLQLRRFQLQLQFQLRRLQLQFQLHLRSFKSNPNSISKPINLVHLNYHYPITMWNIVWIKWRYAVDICHVVKNLGSNRSTLA